MGSGCVGACGLGFLCHRSGAGAGILAHRDDWDARMASGCPHSARAVPSACARIQPSQLQEQPKASGTMSSVSSRAAVLHGHGWAQGAVHPPGAGCPLPSPPQDGG